jgi:predicted dehydrogenase
MPMNRRQFSTLSALALAGTRIPSVAQTPTIAERRIGIAPVGLGSIAEVFMRACSSSQNAQITGLVTGHPQEKGSKFGAQYNVPASSIYTYETFDHIRENPAIDAVYIALPNSMHCEYTVRAAQAGKHVFCEKPMAISSAECRRMIDACRQANVKLMIGYRIHFDPVFLHVRELVQSGALGQVQAIQAGYYGMKEKQQWRLQRALAGGGSLMDLGVYPLNTIRWFTGEEAIDYRAFVATREQGERFAEVEQSIEWMMKFPSGILASAGSSYGQSGPKYMQINGDKGQVHIEPAFSYGSVTYTYKGTTLNGDVSGSGSVTNPDQFVAEVNHFTDCILHNRRPATPGEEGLADLLAIEAIYKAAGAPVA